MELHQSSVYKKLLPAGKLDEKPLTQTDFDTTVQYIKKCFPKASKLQKDIEQTLKRTFVLEETEPKRKHLAIKKPRIAKATSSRKLRIKKEKPVPRNLNFSHFAQLNDLWKSYIANLLQDEERPDEIQQRLNRVDLHGAFISVSDSNCKSYVGLEGIVVKETKNLFILVTPNGTTKSIPKVEGIFDVTLENPKGKMRICGNSFLTRPAERASKKIKSFMEFLGTRVYKSRLRYTYHK